jgi:putative permease
MPLFRQEESAGYPNGAHSVDPGLSSTVQDVPPAGRLLLASATALFAVLVLVQVLSEITYPLALIFGGVVIAQGLAPIVAWLTPTVPRGLAVVLVYLVIVGLAGTAAWYFVPVLILEIAAFAERLPRIEGTVVEELMEWSPVGGDELAAVSADLFGQFMSMLIGLPGIALAAATNLVLVLFLSLYWLIAQPALRGWFLGLIPSEHRDRARDVTAEVGSTVGGYVRGVLISAVLVATLTYAGLLVIGIPSALVLAAFAGIGELIPVLGPFIAAVPALLVALGSNDVNVFVVAAFYLVLQQIESNVVLPLVMRGQAQIPPLLSLVAFLIGAAVGGVVGALIAIPLFGALRVIVVRLLVPAHRRLAGVGEGEAVAVQEEEENREEEEEPADPAIDADSAGATVRLRPGR